MNHNLRDLSVSFFYEYNFPKSIRHLTVYKIKDENVRRTIENEYIYRSKDKKPYDNKIV